MIRRYKKHFLREKIAGYESPSDEGGEASNTEVKTNESEKEPITSENGEETGDNFDEYGYPKSKAEGEETPKSEDENKESEGEEEAEGDEPSKTGYEERPKVDKEPEGEEDPNKKESTEEVFKIEEKGNLLDEEVESLEKFINDNKVPKNLAKALVQKKQDEIKIYEQKLEESKANKEREVQKVRAQWYDELQSDKDFGGDKFKANLKKVDNVLNKHMPNLKKQLTESGAVLPPYVMRDLAKLADHLYGSSKLVTGDPIVPKQTDENDPDAHLDFYGTPKKE